MGSSTQTGNIWDAVYAFRDTTQHTTFHRAGQDDSYRDKGEFEREITELSTTIYGFRPVTAVTLINVLNWAVSTSNCAFENSFRSTTYVIMYVWIYSTEKIWNSDFELIAWTIIGNIWKCPQYIGNINSYYKTWFFINVIKVIL